MGKGAKWLLCQRCSWRAGCGSQQGAEQGGAELSRSVRVIKQLAPLPASAVLHRGALNKDLLQPPPGTVLLCCAACAGVSGEGEDELLTLSIHFPGAGVLNCQRAFWCRVKLSCLPAPGGSVRAGQIQGQELMAVITPKQCAGSWPEPWQ